MLNPIAPLITTVRTWRHRLRYPALPAPEKARCDRWRNIYETITDDRRAHLPIHDPDALLAQLLREYHQPTPPFVPLAIIPNPAWQRLYKFCWAHDIERGSTPWHRFAVGAAESWIHVWSIDLLHPRRWGELLYGFYPFALCEENPFTVMVSTTSPIVLKVRLEHSRRPHLPYSDEIADSRHFLCKLYHHAVGHPLPLKL